MNKKVNSQFLKNIEQKHFHMIINTDEGNQKKEHINFGA